MPKSRTRKKDRPRRTRAQQVERTRSSWSAVRSAEAAVVYRDQFVDFLDTSENAHPATRELMEWELAETLTQWYPDDPVKMAGVAANDFDVWVEESTIEKTREAVVRGWAEQRRRSLSNIPLFIISPEMLPVVIAAAQSLTREDALMIHDASEKRRGMVILPEDVHLTSNPLSANATEPLSALAWFPSRMAARDDEGEVFVPQQMKDTTRMMSFTRVHPAHPLYSVREHLLLAERLGSKVPGLTMVGEAWFPDWEPDDETWERALSEQGDVENNLHLSSASGATIGTATVGTVVEDPSATFMVRFLAAFWRLCDQEIATCTPRSSEPSSKQRARSRKWPEVNVVTLRRSSTAAREDRQPRDVDWQYRWVVQMHRRWQWYPSKGRHELIFVGPYVKGPEDRPLKPTAEQVRSLSR